MAWIRLVIALVACSALFSQDSRQVIVIAGRSPLLEIIDPVTLETLARIHFDFPNGSVGFNSAAMSADGSSVYMDGPIPSDTRGCCVLYSLDLATMKATVVASIFGTRSRDQFVFSDGVVFPSASLSPNGPIKGIHDSMLHFSPDGQWAFGVRGYQGPVLEVFDMTRGKLVRELTPPQSEGEVRASGGWAGEHFYFIAGSKENSGHLWMVSPDTIELGAGVPVDDYGEASSCTHPAFSELLAAGDKVFLYEPFGFKVDRRVRCHIPVPGGVWMIDPATGRQAGRTAIGLHFSTVVADRTGTFLYGLASEALNQDGPGQLLRIDAKDGHVLKWRSIAPGFFRMTVAPISSVPTGDVFVVMDSLMGLGSRRTTTVLPTTTPFNSPHRASRSLRVPSPRSTTARDGESVAPDWGKDRTSCSPSAHRSRSAINSVWAHGATRL